MRARQLLAIVLFNLMPAAGSSAAAAEWQKYNIAETGLSVDVPVTVFTEDAGVPEGTPGRRFLAGVGRTDLTI